MTKAQEAAQQEAIEKLRAILKPGDTITTVLRHVSSSGMYRAIDLFLFDKKGGRRWLSRYVADAGIGRWDDKREAVGAGGAGMDMGFHLVYNLSHSLFPNGFRCTGKNCPSNDHSNGMAYPHAFPDEFAGQPVTTETCPVWDFDENGRRGGRCGLTRAEHPTKRKMHRSGGYALSQEWL